MDKILIIQDSPFINMMLKSRLEEGGFLVDSAETGEEGIVKIKQGRYQLVLLDYKLPKMNGDEVCRILKNEEATKAVPVFFMSAGDEKELQKLTEENMADGYITLPFQAEALMRKIKEVIRHD